MRFASRLKPGIYVVKHPAFDNNGIVEIVAPWKRIKIGDKVDWEESFTSWGVARVIKIKGTNKYGEKICVLKKVT